MVCENTDSDSKIFRIFVVGILSSYYANDMNVKKKLKKKLLPVMSCGWYPKVLRFGLNAFTISYSQV